MRAFGKLLIVVAVLTAIGAFLFYLYVNAMACGFRTSSGPCPLRFDWEMFQLVILPAGLVSLVTLLTGRYLLKKYPRS